MVCADWPAWRVARSSCGTGRSCRTSGRAIRILGGVGSASTPFWRRTSTTNWSSCSSRATYGANVFLLFWPNSIVLARYAKMKTFRTVPVYPRELFTLTNGGGGGGGGVQYLISIFSQHCRSCISSTWHSRRPIARGSAGRWSVRAVAGCYDWSVSVVEWVGRRTDKIPPDKIPPTQSPRQTPPPDKNPSPTKSPPDKIPPT